MNSSRGNKRLVMYLLRTYEIPAGGLEKKPKRVAVSLSLLFSMFTKTSFGLWVLLLLLGCWVSWFFAYFPEECTSWLSPCCNPASIEGTAVAAAVGILQKLKLTANMCTLLQGDMSDGQCMPNMAGLDEGKLLLYHPVTSVKLQNTQQIEMKFKSLFCRTILIVEWTKLAL